MPRLLGMVVVIDESGDWMQSLGHRLESGVVVDDRFEHQRLGEEQEVVDVARLGLLEAELPTAVNTGIPSAESAEVDAVLVLLVEEVVQVARDFGQVFAI